jgi:hypothetical protein
LREDIMPGTRLFALASHLASLQHPIRSVGAVLQRNLHAVG